MPKWKSLSFKVKKTSLTFCFPDQTHTWKDVLWVSRQAMGHLFCVLRYYILYLYLKKKDFFFARRLWEKNCEKKHVFSNFCNFMFFFSNCFWQLIFSQHFLATFFGNFFATIFGNVLKSNLWIIHSLLWVIHSLVRVIHSLLWVIHSLL